MNTTLRAALNTARKHDLIDRNPAAEIALPRDRLPKAVVWTDDLIAEWRRTGTRPPVAVWTAAQTAHFLASCREHQLYATYHLIALRGLRRGETIGLRWCDLDLDLDQGIGYICRQRVRLREQVLETPPKTDTSIRLLILDRTTVAVLRQHRARQLAFCAATGSEPSGYVFTDLRGQPLHPEYLYYAFKKLTKAADLPPILAIDQPTKNVTRGSDLIQGRADHCTESASANRQNSMVHAKVDFSAAVSDEAAPSVEAGDDRLLPIRGPADAYFEVADHRAAGGERALIEDENAVQVALRGGAGRRPARRRPCRWRSRPLSSAASTVGRRTACGPAASALLALTTRSLDRLSGLISHCPDITSDTAYPDCR